MGKKGLSFVLICLLSAFYCAGETVTSSEAIPSKPKEERLVNDLAEIFSKGQRDSLERTLTEFCDSTSNQICVVTVSSLNGYEISEFALRLGNKWGVGSTRNNGIILLLKPKGKELYTEVTIQVGYGLEGAIPDVYAGRIIRNIMGPYLSKQEYFEATSKACYELMKLSAGEISEPRDKRENEETYAGIIILLVQLLIFGFILFWSIKSKSGDGGGTYNDSAMTGSGKKPINISVPQHSKSSYYYASGRSRSSGSRSTPNINFGGGKFGGGGASGKF
ncbi:MAG: TPM domain-containing protein [Bacteroidales bacterium]|nr:TPM domain-containing protein [Bacteroidales bacterium]